jgi:photoactive yellow protein
MTTWFPGTASDAVASPIDAMERLSAMSREEVDDLPYGFVVLDAYGTILLYNRYEARMSRIAPGRVLGRNFFHDVAPCTRVGAFYGRFCALVADPSKTTDRFAFRFHFLHGAQDVLVQFTKAPIAEGPIVEGAQGRGDPSDLRVFMTVVRRMLHPVDENPPALRLDPDHGAAAAPLGRVLPIDGSLVPDLLDRLDAAFVRDFGRKMGESIAAAADRDAPRDGGETLATAPPLLVAGTLDEALARNGLGRLAIDRASGRDDGVFGCLVRPPIRVASRGLATMYEGLLGAVLGAVFEEPMTARCLDVLDLGVSPWRFAAVPTASAAVLEARAGERLDDVARRLGLLTDEDSPS